MHLRGERTRLRVRWLASSPTTLVASHTPPFGEVIPQGSDRRGRRSAHARARVLPNSNRMIPAKNLFENSMESCFRRNGRMARRDEGAYPSWICDREATKPDAHFRENPTGGGPFAWDLCWLGRQSPLWGYRCPCGSTLAALVPAKISRRRAPCNFQTGSKTLRVPPGIRRVPPLNVAIQAGRIPVGIQIPAPAARQTTRG
jgi:hypothetical protein